MLIMKVIHNPSNGDGDGDGSFGKSWRQWFRDAMVAVIVVMDNGDGD